MKWSIGLKIGIMNAIAILTMVLLNLANYYSTNRMLDSLDSRQHSYEVKSNIGTLMSQLVIAESEQHSYLLTNQARNLNIYQHAIDSTPKLFEIIRTLTLDNPEQQRELDLLQPLIARKAEIMQQGLKATDPQQRIAIINTGEDIMKQIRQIFHTMENNENILLKQTEEMSNANVTIAMHVIVYGTLSAIIFLIILGVGLARNIAKPLQAMTSAAKLISTSGNEIYTAVSQLVSTGSETANAVNETTSTIEEVKQTSHLANQKAKTVSESSQQVAQTSEYGKKSIQDTNSSIVNIQGKMIAIAESMMRLSEQTQAISGIIETVDDLAQQSNLLSVNAAIESEKAGEQGKGFRIVAQEIKSLAEQSKRATHRVREILADVQKATNTAVLATEEGSRVVEIGVSKSKDTDESITKLSNSISDACQAAIQIAASSQQQLIGIEQAAVAMENIKQASNQNVDISKQLEISANSLKDLGMKLERMVMEYV
jgi:methyl-accepting chemotaxis protein